MPSVFTPIAWWKELRPAKSIDYKGGITTAPITISFDKPNLGKALLVAPLNTDVIVNINDKYRTRMPFIVPNGTSFALDMDYTYEDVVVNLTFTPGGEARVDYFLEALVDL